MPKPDTQSSQEVTPDPQLEKRTRRIFTADYKLSILQQAAACQHGELGILLRREKLYSNQLAQWRREFSEQGVAGLGKALKPLKLQNKSVLNNWKKRMHVYGSSWRSKTAALISKKKFWR